VQPAPISEINFTAPATKRRRRPCNDNEQSTSTTPAKSQILLPPTDEQLSKFYHALSKVEGKPAILSLHPDYSDSYIIDNNKLSTPLSSLFDESCMNLPYHHLLTKCDLVFKEIKVSPQQAKNIEITTRNQAHSKLWFLYRCGRITASKFKGAVCTDMTQPSPSFLKNICYPEKYKFSSLATKWGCDHEKAARSAYLKRNGLLHVNLTIRDCGLIIHPEFPHFGASPDGIAQCDCCGTGTIEIKCPYSCKEKSFVKVSEDSASFCLETNENGDFTPKRTHCYFYQIQLQMMLGDYGYGDFVVWREGEIVVLRVNIDTQFLKEAMDKATDFSNTVFSQS
jgi:hypothetical protein